MFVTAYVLIAANPGETERVYAALGLIDAVVDRCQVTGPYDIVIKLRAETLNDFPAILGYQIRTVPGVESTTTLVAFPSTSYVAALNEAGRRAQRISVTAGQVQETRPGQLPEVPAVMSKTNGRVQTEAGPGESPAKPRPRAFRCMYPGCGRPRVDAYGFVYGIGRVPLCAEHAAGRDSP